MTIVSPRRLSTFHGAALSCKGWPLEAALRMLMNNLGPAVARRADDLIVSGGSRRTGIDVPSLSRYGGGVQR